MTFCKLMLLGLKTVQSISAFFSVQKRVQSLMLISCIIWVVPSPTVAVTASRRVRVMADNYLIVITLSVIFPSVFLGEGL